jgi:hypothetical protein
MTHGVSKYAVKLAMRNKMNGGTTEGKLPPPLPLSEGYVRNYYATQRGSVSDLGKLLPHEHRNKAQIRAFQTRHVA